MKNSRKIISLILVVGIVLALMVTLTGCFEKETATYYITNTTDEVFIYKLVKDLKILQTWVDVKPGDTIEMHVEITNKENTLKIFQAAKVRGRIHLKPEDGYVDGGYYNVVTHETPGATEINFILVPAN